MLSLFAALPHIFAATAADCSKSFLGLKTWFAYFPDDWFGSVTDPNSCEINTNFSLMGGNGQTGGIVYIALAILDDLLRIAALVAVAFVIYGGISYITSQGSPDSTKKALKTIISALVGLAITIIASALVGFLGTRLSA